MSHYKKLAKETLVYGLGTIVPRFLNFAFYTPYFTRVLTKYEYGLNTEIYSYIMLLMVVLTYGTETTYFKFSNNSEFNEKKIYNNIFTSIIITSCLFIISIFFFSDYIGNLINFGGKSDYILIVAGILFLDVIASIPFAKLRNEKKIIKFSALKIVSVLVNISILVFFFKIVPLFDTLDTFNTGFFGDNLTKILFSNLCASFVTVLGLSQEILKVKLNLNKEIMIKVLIYCSPLLISGLAGVLNTVLDKITFRYFLVDHSNAYEQLGIYSASFRLAVVIAIFNQMFRFAAEPYFFSIAKEKDSKEVYANILKYFIIFSFLIFLGVLFYVDYIQFYLGREFREGLYILPIVLLSNILGGVLINLNFWFKLSSKTKWAIIIVGAGAILTIVSLKILVPLYGFVGCAWANVIANFTMVVLSYSLGRKYYKINYDIKSILFYVLLTSIIFVLGYYVIIEKLWIKTIYVTILLVVYVLIVNRKENLIKMFLKK